MKVVIIGSDSFVGTAIAGRLQSRGHSVFGASRRPIEKRVTDCYSETFFFDLETSAPGQEFFLKANWGADWIIHCAFDPSPSKFNSLIDATTEILAQSRGDQKCRHLLISSISSAAHHPTNYGALKKKLERAFLERAQVVVRLGLVIGRGGLFGRMISQLERWPIVPLFNFGRQNIHYVGLTDLVNSIESLLNAESLPKPDFNLFVQKPIRQKDLLIELRRFLKRRFAFIPVPLVPAIALTRAAETCGIRLPITTDNLKGLERNSDTALSSDLITPACTGEFGDFLRENLGCDLHHSAGRNTRTSNPGGPPSSMRPE